MVSNPVSTAVYLGIRVKNKNYIQSGQSCISVKFPIKSGSINFSNSLVIALL